LLLERIFFKASCSSNLDGGKSSSSSRQEEQCFWLK
jgi:hypothetical protein